MPDLSGYWAANVIWWSEVIGLNDPMDDTNDRILSEDVVSTIVENLRSMNHQQRVRMIAELELMRAVNIAQTERSEEPTVVEDEETKALLQTRCDQHDSTFGVQVNPINPKPLSPVSPRPAHPHICHKSGRPWIRRWPIHSLL